MSQEPASTPSVRVPSEPVQSARVHRDRNYKQAKDKLRRVKELAAELAGSGQWSSPGKLATK